MLPPCVVYISAIGRRWQAEAASGGPMGELLMARSHAVDRRPRDGDRFVAGVRAPSRRLCIRLWKVEHTPRLAHPRFLPQILRHFRSSEGSTSRAAGRGLPTGPAAPAALSITRLE